MKSYLRIILLFLFNFPFFLLAGRESIHPAKQFTQLMIISFVIILGLWLLVWFKRKKRK